jgi:hypothetical protein
MTEAKQQEAGRLRYQMGEAMLSGKVVPLAIDRQDCGRSPEPRLL